MRSDLEVSFRRRGVYRKLEETGKSPFPLCISTYSASPDCSPFFVGERYSRKALCGSTMRWKTSLRFVIRPLFSGCFRSHERLGRQ